MERGKIKLNYWLIFVSFEDLWWEMIKKLKEPSSLFFFSSLPIWSRLFLWDFVEFYFYLKSKTNNLKVKLRKKEKEKSKLNIKYNLNFVKLNYKCVTNVINSHVIEFYSC